MQRRFFISILHTIAAMAGCLVFAWTANAALIDQPMTGATAPGWVLGGTPASASLTGNGAIDPVGDGWLRLTNNSGDQAGYAYFNTSISLSQGVLIQFDYMTWGGSGADGYTMFLFDASVPTFSIGASGGSLGYAMKTGINGISGGYVGIGVDEYGNFATNADGRTSGGGTLRPNTVTIRGPISSAAPPSGGMLGSQSYPWIATSANNGALWANQGTRPTPASAESRRVVMRISPAPSPVVDVWIQFGFDRPLTQMISGAAIGAAPPAGLKLGYAASTGGSTNYHEIRNLVVEPSGYSNSINLGMTKTASVASIAVGSPITYTVKVRNFGPNSVAANGVGIVDTVPAVVSGVTWSCAATGGASCGSASGSGNNLNTTANLPFNGVVTYTISGTLTSYPGATLVNTASLTVPGGVTDYRSSDNSATSAIPVTVPSLDLGITKTTPATGYLLWDSISYTVVAQNKGPANVTVYNAGISDTIPAELTGVSWTCTAAGGATCVAASGSGNSLTTAAHLPLNGTATYTISGTLSSLPPGGTLSNTASLVIPAGYTDTTPANNSASVAIPAAGSIPARGNKPLYLYQAPIQMNRTTNTQTTAITLAAGGGTQMWPLSPVLQLDSTLSPTVNTNVPVYLVLRRGSIDGNRSIRVNLQCSSGGTALTQTQTVALTNTRALYTFNLPLGADLTCLAGNAWNLTVTNNSGADSVRLYPYNAGPPVIRSYANLPTTTVINVDSVSFHSVAYPGVNALASVNAGQTVYVRATVSDPFGSYDISGATITLRDSTGTVRLAPAAMTQVQDSGTANRIYEYAYTVPSTVPAGNWSALVVAKEGTENLVSDNAQAVMPVVIALPNITMLKSAQTVSDPVNNATNPKDIPGAQILYTITATNFGAGAADAGSIVISDSIPAAVSLVVAGSPVTCTNGTPTSGLTFNCGAYNNAGDNVFFSKDNVDWTYTPVAGANTTDPLVRYLKVTPTGPFNGANGGNNPNFTITFNVVVN